jgi:hypothetical protein
MNFNGQSGEQVLADLETSAVLEAVNEWFQDDPYVRDVWCLATPPADQRSALDKITKAAIEAGHLKVDAKTWIRHFVNKMYDDKKLPEIERAQVALHQHVQAQEDHAIQNAPIGQVKQYLTATYRDPVVAQTRRQPFTATDDEPVFPG